MPSQISSIGSLIETRSTTPAWFRATKASSDNSAVKSLTKRLRTRPKEMMEVGKEYGFKQATIYWARKELEGTVVNTAGKKVRGNSWEYVG